LFRVRLRREGVGDFVIGPAQAHLRGSWEGLFQRVRAVRRLTPRSLPPRRATGPRTKQAAC
jgi:hypothetical protein